MVRASALLALAAGVALSLVACNPDPSDEMIEGVGYRPADGDEQQSGERGNVVISEVLWSGSVNGDEVWDVTDAFVEIRNEGSFPTNISKWRLDMTGAIVRTWILPDMVPLDVGEHVFIATKNTGCFPSPDGVIADLEFGRGDLFELTLRDGDERLIEGAGDDLAPPFVGGWDGVRSRSMERVELMFGGEGSEAQAWHFYTPIAVDVPNDDRILDTCRGRTLASPGRPNSPDYSGAFASGNFD